MNRISVALTLIVALLLIGGSVSIFYYRASSNNSTPNNSPTANPVSSSIPSNQPIELSDSIPLPSVPDRFDHMAFDISSQLVFIAARGNDSVDVVSLITNGTVHVISGLNAPQGVAYVSQYNRLYVSNGGDGSVDVFDVGNYSLVKTLDFSADADNMRLDSSSGLLYVGYGEENQSGIGIINTSSDQITGSISLNGHPESFQLEQNGTRIYVNVPTTNSIDVADRVTLKLITTWPLSTTIENFPMALDEKDHRLFVGFWYPSKLIVFNTDTGKAITSLNISSDSDDISYDGNSGLILASCGTGFLEVIKQQNADSYQPLMSIPTDPIARTSLFVPELNELFVAAPQHNGVSAQLMIFNISSS